MTTVTVSPKFQIVIPKEIRKEMKINPGMKLEAILYDGLLHFVPLKPLEKLKGSLKGIDSNISREKDRQL